MWLSRDQVEQIVALPKTDQCREVTETINIDGNERATTNEHSKEVAELVDGVANVTLDTVSASIDSSSTDASTTLKTVISTNIE